MDHVRALAAFLVFNWHFMYVNKGHQTPLAGTFDVFFFSWFAEGHTGVSIFMVLSGYLFAKITGDRDLDYLKFLRARALRLLPLLLVVALLVVLKDTVQGGWDAGLKALGDIAQGVVLPTLPNGGWSITVEFHFYLLFPLLVLLERRLRGGVVLVIGAAACLVIRVKRTIAGIVHSVAKRHDGRLKSETIALHTPEKTVCSFPTPAVLSRGKLHFR